MGRYIKTLWKKALDVNGRCSRRTFWYTLMYNVLIELSLTGTGFLLYTIANNQDANTVSYIGMAVFFTGVFYDCVSNVACVSMAVRRLHDRNMKGYFLILMMFPAVQLFVLVMLLSGSKDAGNRWGNETD